MTFESASRCKLSHLTLILFFFVSALFATEYALAQDKAAEAWWLTSTFSAKQSNYANLSVSEIDSNWVKMEALSYDAMPAEGHTDFEWMRRDGFDFVKEGHLSHGKSIERA